MGFSSKSYSVEAGSLSYQAFSKRALKDLQNKILFDLCFLFKILMGELPEWGVVLTPSNVTSLHHKMSPSETNSICSRILLVCYRNYWTRLILIGTPGIFAWLFIINLQYWSDRTPMSKFAQAQKNCRSALPQLFVLSYKSNYITI